ncbi:MAG: Hsp20/alpha crystallin family protein [Rhodospirillales bacterium]|nr:Hsp20/alpha crystallin family protein [Rhodospirillales bacterium]
MVEKSELSSATAANDWWSHLYGPMRQLGQRVAELFQPNSEAATTKDYYEISVELPGVSEDQISIEVHDHRLTVTGEKQSSHEEAGKSFYFSERTYGSFRRDFRLPADADADNIMATHKDGVLEIKVAKTAPEDSKAKSIKISRG